MNKRFTPDDLRQLLSYDPATGALTWQRRPRSYFSSDRAYASWNTRYSGRPALTYVSRDGYSQGSVANSHIFAHRVAWVIYYGEWPEAEIDHINGVRADNRIENLRGVSRAENQRNLRKACNNTSGVTGVGFNKAKRKWQARINVGGRQRHLGFFGSIESAITARKAAEQRFCFHANHGRAA